MIPVPTETATPPVEGAPAPRAMRADARRNRERVLSAAEAVFSELGGAAQIEEVARRAEVGVGTVCRHFPTKQALIEAVLEALTDSMLASAASALTDPDAGRALRRFALKVVDVSARHRLLAQQLAATVDAATPGGSARQQLRDAIGELVRRAQQAGEVRDDVGPADVALLLAGVVYVTDGLAASQPKLRERAVTVILDGLRPGGATPLSGRAVDFTDLDRITKRKGKR